MDHLPSMSSPIPNDLRVPYLCDRYSTSTTGFWTHPETHHWNRDELKVGLEGHNARALMRSKRQKSMSAHQMIQEIASLLQEWWYFGLLSEVLQADVKHEDFILQDCSGGLSVTTIHLEQYLDAWESRLAEQDPEKALLELKNSKRCVDYVHRQVENLGTFIEDEIATKPVENNVAPSAVETIVGLKETLDAYDSTKLLLSALLETERDFWLKHGRKILSENLELGICVLGHTLSHTIYRIQARLGLKKDGILRDQGTAWYTPAFIHRRLILKGVCPRLVSIRQPLLSLIGMCLASFLQHDSYTGKTIGHGSCSAKRCKVDHLEGGVSTRLHATQTCSCEDLPPVSFYDEVLCVLERGDIPVVRARKEKENLSIEVLSSSETTYVAFSHVWSDGLGNQVENQISRCQWGRLQSIVDEFFPSEPQGSIAFWLDTICVPVVPKERHGISDPAHRVRKKKMRNYAIERMRDTYHNASSVLLLDSTMLSLKAEILSLVEFGLVFSFSRWMQRLWTMHEGAVARWSRVFVRTANGTVQLSNVYQGLVGILSAEISDRKVSLLSSLGVVESYQAWMLNLHLDVSIEEMDNLHYLFRFAWNESRNRATKYEEDRYVVIASMLGIQQPQSFYDYNTEEERMLHLFRQLDTGGIPSAVLFAAGDRVATPGYRWAPSSIDHDVLEITDQVPPAQCTEEGLVVEFEGWRLSQHPSWSRKTWVIRPRGKAVRCPVDSKTVNISGRRMWIMQTKPDDVLHAISLLNEDQRLPPTSAWNKLLVIRQAWRREGKKSNRAFLAVEKNTTREGLIHAQYVAPLRWTWLSTEDERKTLLSLQKGMMNVCVASPVGDGKSTPRWCID